MTGRPRTPRGGGAGDDGEPPGRHGDDGGGIPLPRPRSVAQAQDALAEVAREGRPSERGDQAREPGGKSSPPGSAPDFANVEVDSGKISAYAMNPDHPVGGNKYRVINGVTGLDTRDAARIEQQIRDGVLSGTPIKGKVDQYGQRWAVDVPLTGPRGTITVRTAWILDVGSTTPRLVTISFP